MNQFALCLSVALLLPALLRAQAPPHDIRVDVPPGLSPVTTPPEALLEHSEELLVRIRAAVGAKDSASLRAAVNEYVADAARLRGEVGRKTSENSSPKSFDRLPIARQVASQAVALDALLAAAPRALRSDVKKSLEAADGLLEYLSKGLVSGESRAKAEVPKQSHAAQHSGHH